MNPTIPTSQTVKQATTQPTTPITKPQPSPSARPAVQPVYGICGHIARSSQHTCGAWSCLQMWGW